MAVEHGFVETGAAARAAAELGEQDPGERLVQLGVFDRERLEVLRAAFQRELRRWSSFAPGGSGPTHGSLAAPAQPARRIGHYHLLGELGRGAMGVVHRARDERNGAEVALKLLPPEVAEDAPRRRRLLEEARKAAMLGDCRHVVTVFEAGVVDDRAFFAMELVHGQTFEQWLATPGRADATSDLLLQLIDGVAAAHSIGLVHRDIKPSNLMVTPAGVLKILDFGLAKDVVGPPCAESVDSVVGTPVYMAPELLQMALGLLPAEGVAVHSARLDVYSIGVTACEAFGRDRPFPPTRSYGELLQQKLAVSAIVRRTLGNRPAWPWGRVVPLMLAPDPAGRPADGVVLRRLVLEAGEARTMPRRWLAATTITLVALALGGVALASPDHPVLLFVVVAVLLATAVGALLLPRRQPRPVPKPSAEPPLQRRRDRLRELEWRRRQIFESTGSLPPSGEELSLPGPSTAAPGADDFLVLSLPLARPAVDAVEFLEEYWIGPFCLKICLGDLTRLGAEGWVSTDDAHLSMGGGVSAAIAMRLGTRHRRAAMPHVPAVAGRVVVTEADLSPVRYVLHAITIGVDGDGRGVPPTMSTVSSCVAEVFQTARRLRLRSLAIPSLGTGAGGLPPSEVAKVICGRAIEQLADRTNPTLQTIVFVTGSADDPLLAAIRSRVIETGPRELVVRRGSGRTTASGLVPVA